MDDSMAQKIGACGAAAEALRMFVEGNGTKVMANAAVAMLDDINVSILNENDGEIIRMGRIALNEARDGFTANRAQWLKVAESLDVLAS